MQVKRLTGHHSFLICSSIHSLIYSTNNTEHQLCAVVPGSPLRVYCTVMSLNTITLQNR